MLIYFCRYVSPQLCVKDGSCDCASAFPAGVAVADTREGEGEGKKNGRKEGKGEGEGAAGRGGREAKGNGEEDVYAKEFPLLMAGYNTQRKMCVRRKICDTPKTFVQHALEVYEKNMSRERETDEVRDTPYVLEVSE